MVHLMQPVSKGYWVYVTIKNRCLNLYASYHSFVEIFRFPNVIIVLMTLPIKVIMIYMKVTLTNFPTGY